MEFSNNGKPQPECNLDDFRADAPIEKCTTAVTEDEVKQAFETEFSQDFKLWKEVTLQHTFGSRLRIDFVGRCHRFEWQGLFGFEIKRPDYGEDQFRKLACSLKQGMDYMHAGLESDLVGAPEVFYKRLRYVFIYPCNYSLYQHWQNRHNETIHEEWAMGAVRLAGKYGVGVIQPDAGRYHKNVFLLGGERVYELGKGPTKMRHEISTRFGSAT